MKKLAFAFLALVLLAGCTQVVQSATNVSDQTQFSTCQEFCEAQPHIQCVGEWEVSGQIPHCQCNFVCTQLQ